MKGGKLLLLAGVSILILFCWTTAENDFEAMGINENSTTLSTSSKILYVGGTGPNNYTSIQDAINAASDGDTIFVYAGTYYENIIINKSITLIGENRNTTIIDGNNAGNVVNITANNVTIQGFTIRNSGSHWPHAGIKIWYTNNVIIHNCNISNNDRCGITIDNSRNISILSCDIGNNYHGIVFDSSNKNSIYNCSIIGNNEGGIYLFFSYNNSIFHCNVSNNEVGIGLAESSNNSISHCKIHENWIGMYGWYSNHNAIINNTVNNNTFTKFITFPYLMWLYNNMGIGIYLYDSHDNLVSNNTVTNNVAGLFFQDSANNIISYNTIQRNTWVGSVILGSNNIITNNIISYNGDIGLRSFYYYDGEPGGLLIFDGSNNTLTNNIFIGNFFCGLGLRWNDYNNVINNTFIDNGIFTLHSYHNTILNNIVNGKPLVYLENESDVTIKEKAGQIILVNCNNITIQNQNLSNTSIGIELFNTNNSLIVNNIINNNTFAVILLESSQNNIISNNII
ncbi:MAG: right-handed parallel beta-helix repeat-containing protein, partial [Thermoplasmata archaeon]|nr:right-handed parallel beta-helix repeat-containing protein [Thermoplasmata archaeon]